MIKWNKFDTDPEMNELFSPAILSSQIVFTYYFLFLVLIWLTLKFSFLFQKNFEVFTDNNISLTMLTKSRQSFLKVSFNLQRKLRWETTK